MVKMMYNDELVYKVVIWAFFGISLWTEKVALIKCCKGNHDDVLECINWLNTFHSGRKEDCQQLLTIAITIMTIPM